MSDYGLVLSVFAEPKGSSLSAAASVSDTVLYVDGAQDFDDEGGTLSLNGDKLQYTSLVEGTNPDDPDEINLADPLAVAADEDDTVSPLSGGLVPEDWYAVVKMGDEGDVAHVPIDVDQRNQWPIGEYPDPVPVIVSDDLQHILDAPGRTVSSRNAFLNTDEYTYDGVAASIELPLTKVPISGSEQPFWKAATVAVGGVGLPPGSWRIELPNLIVDDVDLMAEFEEDDLFWVHYAYDAAADDIVRPVEPEPYGDVVMADSPYIYWKLDETSGTTLVDSSGNGKDGTLAGSSYTLGEPALTTETPASSILFNGGRGSVADTTDLTDFTIECWVKGPANVSGDEYVIVGRKNSTFTNHIFELSSSSSGAQTVFFRVQSSSDSTTIISTGIDVFDGVTTHHVVGVHSGGTSSLYVDSVFIGSEALTGSPRTADTAFSVGAQADGTQALNGVYVDEVAYYTTALSPERILAHYNAGTT